MFLDVNLVIFGPKLDVWIEDGSRMDGFVGQWAGWLNSGTPPPTLAPPPGKKIAKGLPQKEDYLWFRKGWMAGHVSMVRRVDVCRLALDSDTPRRRRINTVVNFQESHSGDLGL